MLTLLVLQGPDKGRRFELPDAPTVVGRDSRQLPLTDNTVSRRHFELLPGNDGEWVLRDMGSANGSYVNGGRVTGKRALKLGDQIRVGRTIMVFGAQPGVSRVGGGSVRLSGEEAGMDSAIMHTVPSSEDSMVLSVPEPAAAAVTNLRLLYQLGALLGSSFDVDHVLEVVMDLVFEHVKADRGIILLLDERTNELIPKVVRTRDEDDKNGAAGKGAAAAAALAGSNGQAHGGGGSAVGNGVDEATHAFPPDMPRQEAVEPVPPPPKIHASRTVINHVITNGEGVLSSNAMSDKRFSKGKSVHNLAIRTVMCVPIKARRLDARPDARPDTAASAGAPGGGASSPASSLADIIGVIYIDSSVKNYTYTPDQLRLLTAIGLQAGMAIQNANLYQQGLAAERLAAVGETTAALSHSIKNILQALRGGADVVDIGLRRRDLNQTGKGWGVVQRNLDKIFNLTMNLLSYSKPREPQLELVHPKKLIDECVELISVPAAEKGAMAVADVDADHPAIPMDDAGMHQVLMNLLSNAIDAVPPGGDGLINVKCAYDAENRQSVIEVSDNGVGIAPGMMKHMFELFHSTKGNRGTGLGLAVARKIVEEHEGAITVKSAPGQGTTFTIRLPVWHDAGDPQSTHGPK